MTSRAGGGTPMGRQWQSRGVERVREQERAKERERERESTAGGLDRDTDSSLFDQHSVNQLFQ